MNDDWCDTCQAEHCPLSEARTIYPRSWSIWSEFAAQSPARHLLNVVYAAVLLSCVYVFLVVLAGMAS